MNKLAVIRNDIEQLSREVFACFSGGVQCTDCESIEIDLGVVVWTKMKKTFVDHIEVCYTFGVPGKRHKNKTTFSISMERELHKKLKIIASREGTTVSKLVNKWAFDATVDIELEPEDYEEIAKEIRAWEAKQRKKGNH